jgi:hypothetical protein
MINNYESIWISQLPYKSKVDLYENLYLKAIIDSYSSINKKSGKEEELRDRFYYDLTHCNPLTKEWYDLEILNISFEKWKMNIDKNKTRVDLSFFWSGFGNFEIECKRLFKQPSKNKAYLDNGLVRFINLKYAENNEYAGMLGFVVSGNIDIISDKILNDTKTFHSNGFPIQYSIHSCAHSFISNHTKINKKNIRIYHLHFQFN